VTIWLLSNHNVVYHHMISVFINIEVFIVFVNSDLLDKSKLVLSGITPLEMKYITLSTTMLNDVYCTTVFIIKLVQLTNPPFYCI